MEININIDLETALQNAITAAVQPDKLQALIQGKVEDAVKNALNEATGYRSPFQKAVTDAITAAMPADIDHLGRLSDAVLKILQAQVEKAQNEFITQAMAEKIAQLIPSARREVKLSDLIREMAEGARTFVRDIECKIEDATTDGYWYLEFGNSRARFNADGKCYDLSLDGYDCKKTAFIGSAYGEQKVLLGLYTQQTTVIRDINQDDVEDLIYELKNGQED